MDTMEEGPNGALYRLDPDHSLHKLDDRIIVSNGPCWSPDGRIFYFADTWSGEIWAYDYDLDTGAVSNKRTFAKVDRSRGGAADGSTVDAEGCLWNAQVYDGKIVRYAPDGSVETNNRHAGQEGDERHVRRTEPRHPLRHVDGQASPAAFPRRRRPARQPVCDPRSRHPWCSGAAFRRIRIAEGGVRAIFRAVTGCVSLGG